MAKRNRLSLVVYIFLGLVYGDQGRLNQWYSFAGEYSVNGTIKLDTATGEFDDSGEQQTYEPQSNTGNLYKDKCVDIYGMLSKD